MNATIEAPAPSAAPVTTPNPRAKRQRDFDPWAWRPAVSAPQLHCEISLKTVFAQKLLQQLFGRLQVALYGMSVTIPIMERDMGATGSKLADVFQRSHQHLTHVQHTTTERYRQWLQAAGAPPAISYQAQTRHFPVFCPNAKRALEHFSAADNMIQLLDQLWYANVLDATQHKRAVLETCAQVKNFSREMEGLWLRSKAAVLRAQATPKSPADAVTQADQQATTDPAIESSLAA
ncbi:hypothetical protein C7S18_20025 [Ahniella affigens]|uniref:DUF1845 domain-containing protein n=1 Tax=Ahniella affigens TaxID=2021234 RepID=A0A2P1PWV4_9GAMM|nr:hypothetical protein [Ahniella affigens]AVP99316.1 hypothetical protein C7S18_20025 [Ahniella affigens]